jgi:DNA-binding transcriptional LysR family regulator
VLWVAPAEIPSTEEVTRLSQALSTGRDGTGRADGRHGRLQRSALGRVVPDFLTGLHLASTTDLVVIAPARIVAQSGTALGVNPIEAPVPLRQLRISQLWHPRHHHDPVHQWLRRHITETAALPNGPAADSPNP